MAAKQGTLAQLSAQAEDAKRAVLTKAGVSSSSWFSNLNTVCTIKSAPPRSPDVLQLLATKAGWLYKRNEQHVWQARWCCVVPHTFLYYFDAPAVGGTGVQNPPTEIQEEWNNAIKNGLGNRKQHEKRSNFSLFHGGAGGDANAPNSAAALSPGGNYPDSLNDSAAEHTVPSAHNVQPAGIIDLECYSTIYRSTENQAVLELAGDDQVNPDLRSFYFCCENVPEVEEWNSAFLNNRHSALQDEVEAYKQVADGFAQQLQMLHENLDEAASKQEDSERELYRVRSSAEETRRTVYRVAADCWDRAVRPVVDTDIDLEEKRAEFRRNMETIRSQDMGVAAAVRLMADYCGSTEDLCAALQTALAQLQNDVQKSGQTDQAAFADLQAKSEAAAAQHAAEKEQLLQQLAAAQAASQAATKELQDVQKDLSSTKMEVTMLMQQQRNKLATQAQHKKILKKEVIDLRQKVEDIHSEQSTLQHEYEKLKMQLEQERSKSDLMSRYVNKMESQVQVQQNMMEMMSQAGSVYGGGMSVVHRDDRSVRSHRSSHNDFASPGKRSVLSNRAASMGQQKHAVEHENMDDNDDENDAAADDFEDDERMLLRPPSLTINAPPSGRKTPGYAPRRAGAFMSDNDLDNKSHVSELTEDRTQREFAAILGYHQQHQELSNDAHTMRSSSPRLSKRQQEARNRLRATEKTFASYATSPRQQRSGPPSLIIGVKTNANDDIEPMEEDEEEMHHEQAQQEKTRINRLDTINSNTSSAPPPLPQRGSATQPGRDAVSLSSVGDTLDSTGRKLSVAERARLEADQKSTPVRARLDEKSLSSLSKRRGSTSTKLNESFGSVISGRSPSPGQARASGNSGGPTGGVGGGSSQASAGGLWRRMEEAVLGPRDSDEESSDSQPSTRVTEVTEDSRARDEAKRRFAPTQSSSSHVDEKKSSDSVSLSVSSHSERQKLFAIQCNFSLTLYVSFLQNLSLQERSQLQRDKQLRFLREQGLIKDASDVKGGAGALESPSVSSSTTSPSKLRHTSPAKAVRK